MIDEKIFDIYNRIEKGEYVSDEERDRVRNRNFKYELIRYIYMEKMRLDGCNVVQFHFSPGVEFEETPIYDILKGIFDIHEKTVSGEIKPLSAEEFSRLF